MLSNPIHNLINRFRGPKLSGPRDIQKFEENFNQLTRLVSLQPAVKTSTQYITQDGTSFFDKFPGLSQDMLDKVTRVEVGYSVERYDDYFAYQTKPAPESPPDYLAFRPRNLPFVQDKSAPLKPAAFVDYRFGKDKVFLSIMGKQGENDVIVRRNHPLVEKVKAFIQRYVPEKPTTNPPEA